MYLSNALKITGKATRVGSDDFLYIKGNGVLTQCAKTDGNASKEYKACELLDKKWNIYDIEQIIPSEVGEIWEECDLNSKWCVHNTKDGLMFSSVNDSSGTLFGTMNFHKKIIHGKNDWTRVFPKVLDKNIEEIVIENVSFGMEGRKVYIKQWDKVKRVSILDQKMDVILRKPKES